MDVPNKRLLTEESRQSSSNSDNFFQSSCFSTSEDLTQSLRNAGARVRKSVQEGYRTTPSAFSRAQSVGSIFTPMNATLQHVYEDSNSRLQQGDANDSVRKRSRSATREGSPIREESDMEGVQEQSVTGAPTRPMKPLRTSRRNLFETRSLPASAFAFGGANQPNTASTTEETDWSEDMSNQTSKPAFEPIVFDSEF